MKSTIILATNHFIIEDGALGPRLTLQTMWEDSLLAVIEKEKVVGLELNYAKGWKSSPLDFLERLPGLLELVVVDWNLEDVSAINLLHALKRLHVFTYCKSAIQFYKLHDLEDVALEWRAGARSIHDCPTLRRVFINHWRGRTLEPFRANKCLEWLSLANAKLEHIGDLRLPQLKSLEINRARRLTSLAGLEPLSTLTALDISGCKGICDLSEIATLSGLEELSICDMADVASLEPIAYLDRLRKIHMYGNTNILDGNLAVLDNLEVLQSVSFQERSHYNRNRGDFAARKSNGSE